MKLSVAAVLATSAFALAGSAMAGELNPRVNTANLEYGKVLKIRLPYGLCEFERAVPAYVVTTLSERRDWNRLVEYMLVNCPELGLPLADTATASISDVDVDDSNDGTGGAAPSGSGGSDPSGNGGSTASDDDGNNGHGNDADRHDDSNPGKGRP